MKINWFKIKRIDIEYLLTELILRSENTWLFRLEKYLKLGPNICKDCNRNYDFCFCDKSLFDYDLDTYEELIKIGINYSKFILPIIFWNYIVHKINNSSNLYLSDQYKNKILNLMLLK